MTSSSLGKIVSPRQRERVVTLIEKGGARGHTAAELEQLLYWPADSVQYWIADALDAGEIAVAPGEGELPAAERHYVTIATWRNAQADGDLGE